ncbi:MAG: ABC transporter permease [Acidobacteriota bacterium]
MDSTRTLVIEPTPGWRALDLREVWAYRELLIIFAWRDLKVRYRQTLLGALWVMGQPLVSMLIFTLLFSRVAKLPVGTSVPYPVFVMAGILIWNFASSAVQKAGNSLIGAGYLISKVYFPRLVIPLSSVISDLADFAIAGLLLIPMMLWYGITPGPTVLLTPLLVALAAMLAIGIGLWVAALNVEYRDIRVVIPWVLQIAMYVTPVVYPLSALPERYRWIALANPMTGVVEGFRAALFGTPLPQLLLLISLAAAVFFLLTGAFYFRRMERLFADVL